MAITTDDFNKIWASTSPLTPYSFSASQYKEGWNFIGSTPPSRQMWDYLQKNNDEKMQYLANNYLPLNGGTLTGDVFGVTPPNGDNSKKLATTAFVNAKAGNYLPLSGGTLTGNLAMSGKTIHFIDGSDPAVAGSGGWIGGIGSGLRIAAENYGLSASGGRIELRGRNYATDAGKFDIVAANTSAEKVLTGKPDGTLTWDGQPLLPVGVVQAFAGTTIPNGWLLCDGSAVSRTDYAALFAVIGTTYGSGDGSTTFNLPNLTDKFIQGSATAGTEKSAGLPNITGEFTAYSYKTGNGNGAFNSSVKSPSVLNGALDQNLNWISYTFDASRSNSIYGISTTVQPPALTMRYIIKY